MSSVREIGNKIFIANLVMGLLRIYLITFILPKRHKSALNHFPGNSTSYFQGTISQGRCLGYTKG